MTTEKHAWLSGLGMGADGQREHHGVCRCGQELDICSRSHCPRCGATVVAHVAVPAAAVAAG